jgi:S-formylglutathione hydrolase
MQSYVSEELPALLAAELPIDLQRQGIAGHSMGGHGALVTALRHPGRYRSVSAFAPIARPTACPWGRKALGRYLGADETRWATWDTCRLLDDGHTLRGPAGEPLPLLVDVGGDDPFLAEQLRPDDLAASCAAAGQPLTLRRQTGYDHSYFFVASFLEDHLKHHARALAG